MMLAVIGALVLIIVGGSFLRLKRSPPRKLNDDWFANDYEAENERNRE